MHFLPLTAFPSLFTIFKNLKILLGTFRKALFSASIFIALTNTSFALFQMEMYLVLFPNDLCLHNVSNISFFFAIAFCTYSFNNYVSSPLFHIIFCNLAIYKYIILVSIFALPSCTIRLSQTTMQ